MDHSTAAGFAVYETGAIEEWLDRHVILHPEAGKIRGKKWLKEELQLTGTEISVGTLPPGAGVPFVHAHKQNEEIYLFLAGQGEMLLDEQTVPITAGTVVRVDPPVKRSWRNTGSTPLSMIVIQVKAGSLEQWTATDGIITGPDPWT